MQESLKYGGSFPQEQCQQEPVTWISFDCERNIGHPLIQHEHNFLPMVFFANITEGSSIFGNLPQF